MRNPGNIIGVRTAVAAGASFLAYRYRVRSRSACTPEIDAHIAQIHTCLSLDALNDEEGVVTTRTWVTRALHSRNGNHWYWHAAGTAAAPDPRYQMREVSVLCGWEKTRRQAQRSAAAAAEDLVNAALHAAC